MRVGTHRADPCADAAPLHGRGGRTRARPRRRGAGAGARCERRRDRARRRSQLRRRGPERRRDGDRHDRAAGRDRAGSPSAALVRSGRRDDVCASCCSYLAARGLTLPVVPGHAPPDRRRGDRQRRARQEPPARRQLRPARASPSRCALPPTGRVPVCPEREPELFDATLGGMGLTGVVVEATLRAGAAAHPLARWRTSTALDTSRAGARAGRAPSSPTATRSPGSICSPRAPRFGRSVLTRSDEAPASTAQGGRGDERQRWLAGLGVERRGCARASAILRLRCALVSPCHVASPERCCAPRRCEPSTRCTGAPLPAARADGRSA